MGKPLTWKKLKELVETAEGFHEEIEINYIDISGVDYTEPEVNIEDQTLTIF